MQRLSQIGRHLAARTRPPNRTLATMAPVAGKLDISAKYRMPDGYEIPAIGFGVSLSLVQV